MGHHLTWAAAQKSIPCSLKLPVCLIYNLGAENMKQPLHYFGKSCSNWGDSSSEDCMSVVPGKRCRCFHRHGLGEGGGSARRVNSGRKSKPSQLTSQHLSPCNLSSWHDCSHISSCNFTRQSNQEVIQCSCQGPWVLIPSHYPRFPCNSCLSQMIRQKESLKGESSLQFWAVA